MFHVYVLRCSDGTLYIGLTNSLERRVAQHANGEVKRTKSRLPVTLVLVEHFETRQEARAREKALKTGFGRKWLKKHVS